MLTLMLKDISQATIFFYSLWEGVCLGMFDVGLLHVIERHGHPESGASTLDARSLVYHLKLSHIAEL